MNVGYNCNLYLKIMADMINLLTNDKIIIYIIKIKRLDKIILFSLDFF